MPSTHSSNHSEVLRAHSTRGPGRKRSVFPRIQQASPISGWALPVARGLVVVQASIRAIRHASSPLRSSSRTSNSLSCPPPGPFRAWMAPALVRDLLFSCHRPCWNEYRPPAAVGLGPSLISGCRLVSPPHARYAERARRNKTGSAHGNGYMGRVGGYSTAAVCLIEKSTCTALSRIVYISRRRRPDKQPFSPSSSSCCEARLFCPLHLPGLTTCAIQKLARPSLNLHSP
ncbi:hypothetical protein M441DRAFT_238569 [Trichoderma asperellum CBS 433.97]|uniref:Uncharacterized protein n=1 Tax=Trichoderma asperellum (strain ATCC 204424 / CBS 433.97 / NBRC 101777) TaxID=1042311 RepID=A0A2T3Z1U3_TRIA4|nr:hypothetical protein M441DRAFT_238569 [Trichoderma asperellum CBS 433.97]PTB38773.1 hypothetical protein M441DRAFT_238569 [Trichoderma asperellum CBS 433.97]